MILGLYIYIYIYVGNIQARINQGRLCDDLGREGGAGEARLHPTRKKKKTRKTHEWVSLRVEVAKLV